MIRLEAKTLMNHQHMALFIILAILPAILAGCAGIGGTAGNALYQCKADTDCAPRPECHPLECINEKYIDAAQRPKACTLVEIPEAAYSKGDCACSKGLCINRNRIPQPANGTDEAASLAYARRFVAGSSNLQV
jgi:hypothetical protein